MIETMRFEVTATAPVALAVAPSIAFRMRATIPNVTVHALVMRIRIRVDAARRTYTTEEKARLGELFGSATQWSTSVGRFEGQTAFDVVVPCTYDLAHATTKLFDALDHGSVPLTFAFSGTVFADIHGELAIVPLAADAEARTEVPIATWRELMDAHHPLGALVPLKRELVDRLRQESGAGTLEHAIERLLDQASAATNVRRGAERSAKAAKAEAK